MDHDDPEPTRPDAMLQKRVNFLACCACLNSVALGYQIGAVTVSNQLVDKDLDLTNTQLTIYEMMINVTGIVGALLAGSVSAPMGRRFAFLVAAFFFVLGSLCQAFAASLPWLLLGAGIIGLAVGLGFAVDPIYISEISPPGDRGYFVTWSEVSVASGQELGFVAAFVIQLVWPDWDSSWRLMLGLGAAVPVAIVIAVIFYMPESPRWLAVNGREDEARDVLLGLGHSEASAGAILDAIATETRGAPVSDPSFVGFVRGVVGLCSEKPAVRRMMLVGIMAPVAQQVSGTDAVYYTRAAGSDAASGGGPAPRSRRAARHVDISWRRVAATAAGAAWMLRRGVSWRRRLLTPVPPTPRLDASPRRRRRRYVASLKAAGLSSNVVIYGTLVVFVPRPRRNP